MIVAEIDKDYINTEPHGSFNRVGKKFELKDPYGIKLFSRPDIAKVRFRCKDDDGEVYYGGWLYNDPQGEIQLEVLRWCMNDAGCTTIEVKLNSEWKQEIG